MQKNYKLLFNFPFLQMVLISLPALCDLILVIIYLPWNSEPGILFNKEQRFKRELNSSESDLKKRELERDTLCGTSFCEKGIMQLILALYKQLCPLMEKIKLKAYLVKGMQGYRGKHNYNKKINLLKFCIKTCTLPVYKIT